MDAQESRKESHKEPRPEPHQASHPGPAEPCPDLTALSLAELREAQHPVLDAVLADLREREERPGEMLWGFNSAL